MRRTFTARAVAFWVDEKLNFKALAMAEEEHSGERLDIQRALVDDEQDRELGQDTYCLVDEYATVIYGGITRWELENGELRLDLTAEASQVLDAGVGYTILVPDLDHQTVIRDALPELLI
ncbi:Imm10 family immunity protein [Solirubrobacter taibaiensis]|nr:Imm10 family immunity protein [Solirubrobacter taibaiensis]